MDVSRWPAFETLSRILLALGVGLFVGLEREWRGKEAGLRTFAFVSLLGGLGALLGTPFALAAIAGTAILILVLNWASIRAGQGIELTTSAALLVMTVTGITCGLGHRFTPAAVAVITAGLLAWKERLASFSHRLTAEELRSAILLGLLAFAIFPVLPTEPVDPWKLVYPRAAFTTVLLIAALGFVNYVLLKAAGPRGIAVTGFLGGLVNSTVTVTEMAERTRVGGLGWIAPASRAIALATTAMLLRNAVLLGILAPAALRAALLPFLALLITAAAFALLQGRGTDGAAVPELPLRSPFSLRSALYYGLLFIALEVLGETGRRALGPWGLYAVSLVGGLVSSASAVASAGSLSAHGMASWALAGNAALIASLASISVNAVIVSRVARMPALVRATLGMVLVLVLTGSAVLIGQHLVVQWLHEPVRHEVSAGPRKVETRGSIGVNGSWRTDRSSRTRPAPRSARRLAPSSASPRRILTSQLGGNLPRELLHRPAQRGREVRRGAGSRGFGQPAPVCPLGLIRACRQDEPDRVHHQLPGQVQAVHRHHHRLVHRQARDRVAEHLLLGQQRAQVQHQRVAEQRVQRLDPPVELVQHHGVLTRPPDHLRPVHALGHGDRSDAHAEPQAAATAALALARGQRGERVEPRGRRAPEASGGSEREQHQRRQRAPAHGRFPCTRASGCRSR